MSLFAELGKDARFNSVTATTFTGHLVGNADSATKATNDAKGQKIDTTYAKKVDLSNYYTKTQVDSAISTAISAITNGDNKSY